MSGFNQDQKADLMDRFPIFSGLSRDFLVQLAGLARPIRVKRREVLFREGDPAKGFYLLVEGKIKLTKISPGGKEQILHFVKPGNSFAEAALYSDGKFPAFAETLEDSTLLFIPSAGFADLLAGNQELAMNLIAHLAQLLQLLSRKVEELSLMDATSRLSRYLLANINRETGLAKLSMGKGQTASSLGMAVETFSRTLTKLKEDGIIKEVSPGIIQILDVEALELLTG
jgi:CRP/FNR family transcriptional regulator